MGLLLKACMSKPETIEVIDIHEFVQLLSGWHSTKVTVLRHMQSIPEGSQVAINDGEMLTLEGKYLLGFQAGLQLALMELGTLPFMFNYEEEDAVTGSTQIAADSSLH